MQRAPLTTTHPHGYLLVPRHRNFGLVRISKNASTESKNRLDCRDWIAFGEFDGPSIAFLRDPYRRFLSSIPETLLRMTHAMIEERQRKDRVVIPEDVHGELLRRAGLSVEEFVHDFLDLVEYAFFDAHHEPQVSFLADRHLRLRIDPWLYPTEQFEMSIGQIERRFEISAHRAQKKSNEGGAKPSSGRTPLRELGRRLTRSGVHLRVRHSGFLGQRYLEADCPITIRQLNGLANRFASELKTADLGEAFRERVLRLYAEDLQIWERVTAHQGDVRASIVWPSSESP